MHFNDGIVEFGFDCKARKLSDKTISNYQKQLRYMLRYLEAEFQVNQVEEVRSFHIKQFLVDMADKGRKPQYINDLLKVFKTFFNYMKKEGYIKEPLHHSPHSRLASAQTISYNIRDVSTEISRKRAMIMSKYMDRARELRSITTPHYNCAQSVLLPFAPGAGVSEATAYQLAANFGAGMKMASVCGAITGGLMALGLYGVDDQETIGEYYRRLRGNHQNEVNCGPLLKNNADQGREKKSFCDGIVYECVALVEEILQEKGKL